MSGMNGNAEAASSQAQKPATLSIASTNAHGADPEGKEAVIVIGSISGQAVQLHFPNVETLADFSLAVKGALNQMRQNSRRAGDELVAATPVNKFVVGHVSGLPGTVLVMDPDTANEATFVFDNAAAVEAGKLLVVEGGKRLRIDEAIAGGKKITMPAKPRLIRPGEH